VALQKVIAVRKPHRWRPGMVALREIQKFKKNGKTLHIPTFSKTRSPWTVCTFCVIPEQGKCVEIFFLFQGAAQNKSSDF
jgi:hypothetical protein